MIGQAALWVVVIAALVSAADYFRRFNLFQPAPSPTSPWRATATGSQGRLTAV